MPLRTIAVIRVRKMKGQDTQLVVISLFLALLVITCTAGALGKFTGNNGLYEKIAGGAVDVASKDYQAFLGRLQAVFTGDTLNGMCTNWYTDCGGTSSPWNNKPGLDESDIDEASRLLCFDKGSEPRKKIDEAWSKADPEFAKSSDELKREIMKRACIANLRDAMTEENEK